MRSPSQCSTKNKSSGIKGKIDEIQRLVFLAAIEAISSAPGEVLDCCPSTGPLHKDNNKENCVSFSL